MPQPKQPTVIGRGLGRELRALREDKKMSCRKVAEQLGWQASKISRMETGNQGVRSADLASLLVVYGVTGKERERMLKLAERSEDTGYWESIPSLSWESKTLIRLERDAIAITNFEPLLIPGLLQTDDYIRAVMTMSRVSKADIDARMSARLARRSLMTKEEPLDLVFIVDEFVLRRVVGTPKHMAWQMRSLLEVMERSNVTLQVLPLSLHGHPGLNGSFMLLDYARSKPVVHLEHRITGLFLEESEEVDFYRSEADTLSGMALSHAESAELIATIAKEHDRE